MKQIPLDALLWHGRTFDFQHTRYANHTNGGFSLHFCGTALSVKVCSKKQPAPEDYGCFLLLTVNGKETVFPLQEGEQTLCLVEEKEPVSADVSLIKRTEQQYATFGVMSLLADDQAVITKPEEKKRKLLFVGDSITCGYGIGGDENEPNFRTDQQFGDLAFAARCAKALHAEAQFVSRSGVGVYSSYTADREQQNTTPLISDLLPYTDCVGAALVGAEPEKWDPRRFTPDAIVINLGSNDISYVYEYPERRAAFGAAYDRLLTSLRQDYPRAEIVCILGGDKHPEQAALLYWINLAVEKRRVAGDMHISCMPVPFPDAKDGMGGAGHPSMKTQIRMAEELTEFLKLRLGL